MQARALAIARKVAVRAAYACALLWGLRILVDKALEAFGGREKLMSFETNEAHRFTSMAMLHGSLKLRSAVSLLWSDEQIFNGAVYTHWGFGVPLLQLPFHAYASKMRAFPFFADRAIFFAYLTVTIAFAWAGFDRLLRTCTPLGSSRVRRNLLSWAATGFAFSCALYPLMAARFIVYEEAICYLVVCELFALSAYLFTVGTWRPWAVGALGAAASIGLLIRPTGLFYLVMWAALVVTETRSKKAVAIFAASGAPFIGFWFFSNWVRSGTPFGLGMANAEPWSPFHTPMLRFGSSCIDSLAHAREATERLLDGLFVSTATPASPWLQKCHFLYEEQPMPSGMVSPHEPFLGMTVLVVVGWMFLHLIAMRERRIAIYAPFLVLFALFGSYVWAGAGFAWRYIGDFWPAIVAACAQYLRALPPGGQRLLGLRLALVFVAGSYVIYDRKVEPFQATIETVKEEKTAAILDSFRKSQTTRDPPLPSRIACADHPTMPFHNALGWGYDCSIDTFTNVYLGVTAKGDNHYDLRFDTQGVSGNAFRVYVNGRYYYARRDGDSYHATVDIPFKHLDSPVVVVTIQWTRALDPPKGKLLSVQLT